VLSILRSAFAPRSVTGASKLILLAAFLALSAALAALIGRCYADPLNYRVRRLAAVQVVVG